MRVQNALVVVSILLALYVLFYRSANLVNSPFGKLVLIGGVLAITYHYGKVPGVLSAAVAVLLLHNEIEGMENKDEEKEDDSDSDSDSDSKDDDKKTITITDVVEETITENYTTHDKASEEDEEAAREKKAAAVSTQNIVAQEEASRPKQSKDVNDAHDAHVQESFIGGGAIEPMACHSSALQGSYLS